MRRVPCRHLRPLTSTSPGGRVFRPTAQRRQFEPHREPNRRALHHLHRHRPQRRLDIRVSILAGRTGRRPTEDERYRRGYGHTGERPRISAQSGHFHRRLRSGNRRSLRPRLRRAPSGATGIPSWQQRTRDGKALAEGVSACCVRLSRYFNGLASACHKHQQIAPRAYAGFLRSGA